MMKINKTLREERENVMKLKGIVKFYIFVLNTKNKLIFEI